MTTQTPHGDALAALEAQAPAEPLPREFLDRAARKLARKAAALMCTGMAETDVGPEELDRRLGEGPGYTVSKVVDLLNGVVDDDTRNMAHMAAAMGVELQFRFVQNAPAEPAAPEAAG